MNMPTSLWVVITDFNGCRQTARCLASLFSGKDTGFRVVVVDHGTDGATAHMLAAEFPQVERLAASPELWWTGATNAGIRHALARGADMLMLVNNDCVVPPDMVAELRRQSLLHAGAIVAPVQRDYFSGAILSLRPGSCFLLGFPTLRGPSRISPRLAGREVLPVPLIAGGRGAIIPADVLRRVGGFDEHELPHYGADHDFYLRARRAGVRLLTCLHAFIEVDNGSTSEAVNPGRLDREQLLSTLRSRRSHHNLQDVGTLFRRHYPVPGLARVGVFLYTTRYLVLWLFRRAAFLLAGAGDRDGNGGPRSA